MKFTFRKQPYITGLAGVGHPHQTHEIKHQGSVVGYISPPTWQTRDNLWRVSFAIKQEAHPGWTWRFLKKKFDSAEDARTFVQTRLESVLARMGATLHYFEADR